MNYKIESSGKYISFFKQDEIFTISGKNRLTADVKETSVTYKICGKKFEYNWTKPDFTVNGVHPADTEHLQDINNLLIKSVMEFLSFYLGGGEQQVWGGITGDITNQSDLITELDKKADTVDLGVVAFTNDYDDLDNKPEPQEFGDVVVKVNDTQEGVINLGQYGEQVLNLTFDQTTIDLGDYVSSSNPVQVTTSNLKTKTVTHNPITHVDSTDTLNIKTSGVLSLDYNGSFDNLEVTLKADLSSYTTKDYVNNVLEDYPTEQELDTDLSELQQQIDLKANTNSISTVGFTGQYADLLGEPMMIHDWANQTSINYADAMLTKQIRQDVDALMGGEENTRGSVYNAFNPEDNTWKVTSFTVQQQGTGYAIGDAVFIASNAIDAVFILTAGGWIISKKGDFETNESGIVQPSGGNGTGLTLNITMTQSAASTLNDIINPVNGNIAYVIKDELHNDQAYVYGFMDYNGDGISNWVAIAKYGGEGQRDFTLFPIQQTELGINAVSAEKVVNGVLNEIKMNSTFLTNINNYATAQAVNYADNAYNNAIQQLNEQITPLYNRYNHQEFVSGYPFFNMGIQMGAGMPIMDADGEYAIQFKYSVDNGRSINFSPGDVGHFKVDAGGAKWQNFRNAFDPYDPVTLVQQNNIAQTAAANSISKTPLLDNIKVTNNLPIEPDPKTLYIIPQI